MAEWTRCPSCQLKHAIRPDGLCPRCRHPGAGFTGGSPPIAYPPAQPGAAGTGWSQPGVAVPLEQPTAGSGWSQPGVAVPPAQPAVAGSGWSQPGFAVPAAQPAGLAAAPDAFTVGRFISSVFSTWWRNAGLVIPVGVLLYAPAAVAMYLAYSRITPGMANSQFAFFGGSFIATMVLLLGFMPLEMGAIARAGVRRLQREPVELGDMLSTAGRYYFPALGLLVLAGLAYLGTACTVVVPMILLTGWAASLPAMITEGLGPVEAMKRSWALTRGLRWQVFAGFLVVTLAMTAVACVVQGLMSVAVIAAVAGAGGGAGGGAMGGVQAASMLMQGLESSVMTTGVAVAYHQLRVATEGPGASQLGRVFE